MTGGMDGIAILAENGETEMSRFIECLVRNIKILAGDTLLETGEEREIRECLEMRNF